MTETITFWADNPNLVTRESCYALGCSERTSGGGTRGGVAVSLCEAHQTDDGYASGVERLASWKT